MCTNSPMFVFVSRCSIVFWSKYIDFDIDILSYYKSDCLSRHKGLLSRDFELTVKVLALEAFPTLHLIKFLIITDNG